MEFTGQTAIVTGVARGFGRAIVRRLARGGARVVAGDINLPGAEETAALVKKDGGEAAAFHLDVASAKSVQAMVDLALSQYANRVDILVNNAGIWKSSPIEEMSDSEWDEMMDVNLRGTFNCIRAAVPPMKEARSGRIVNISSTAGQRGEAFSSHYAATKGAVISLTKSLAVELAPFGILVNCVAPGWVVTDMTRDDLLGARRVMQHARRGARPPHL